MYNSDSISVCPGLSTHFNPAIILANTREGVCNLLLVHVFTQNSSPHHLASPSPQITKEKDTGASPSPEPVKRGSRASPKPAPAEVGPKVQFVPLNLEQQFEARGRIHIKVEYLVWSWSWSWGLMT